MRRDEAAVFALCGLIVAAVCALALVQPYMEARTFNRCTGSNITTWDAMWADFRVFECRPEVRK